MPMNKGPADTNRGTITAVNVVLVSLPSGREKGQALQ